MKPLNYNDNRCTMPFVTGFYDRNHPTYESCQPRPTRPRFAAVRVRDAIERYGVHLPVEILDMSRHNIRQPRRNEGVQILVRLRIIIAGAICCASVPFRDGLCDLLPGITRSSRSSLCIVYELHTVRAYGIAVCPWYPSIILQHPGWSRVRLHRKTSDNPFPSILDACRIGPRCWTRVGLDRQYIVAGRTTDCGGCEDRGTAITFQISERN